MPPRFKKGHHDPARIAQLVKQELQKNARARARAITTKIAPTVKSLSPKKTSPVKAPEITKLASPVKAPEIAKLASPVRDSLPNLASPVRDSLPNMGSPDPKRKSTPAASASLRRVAPTPLLILTHSPEKYLGVNPRRAVHTARH